MDKIIEYGPQPFDKIMNELSLANHDIVSASTKQITHKMVSKARKGRRLTRNVQEKIVSALNAAQSSTVFSLKDLFTYDGG